MYKTYMCVCMCEYIAGRNKGISELSFQVGGIMGGFYFQI